MQRSIVRSAAMLFMAVVLCTAWIASSLAAEDDEEGGAKCPDRSQYTLFNPAPANCLREFDPDRPDVTDSPFTIDAGHIEFETGLFGYDLSRPDREGIVTEEFDIAATDIRLGITNYAELGLFAQPLNIVHTKFPRSALDTWHSGPGSLEVHAKFNPYGNDSFEKPGSTALALLPAIEIPTEVGDQHIQGAIAVPFAIKLSEKAELEMMTEYDFHTTKRALAITLNFSTAPLCRMTGQKGYLPILKWRPYSERKIPRVAS